MTTAAEEIISRYTKVETETDILGRVIEVKRLKGSQRLRMLGMTGDLASATQPMPNPEWKDGEDPSRQFVQVPIQSLMVIAASVCAIDGVPVPPAKTRAELDAIYDRLDDEGLAAAAMALSKLTDAGAGEEDVTEAAKK